MARGTLITDCYKDLGFVGFIYTLVTKSIKAYSENSGNCSTSSDFLFLCVHHLYRIWMLWRKSDSHIQATALCSEDYKASTYMKMCQLVVKVVDEGPAGGHPGPADQQVTARSPCCPKRAWAASSSSCRTKRRALLAQKPLARCVL